MDPGKRVDFVRGMLHDMGIPDDQMPDIRFTDRTVKDEDGRGTLGKYLSPGQRLGSETVTKPTICLSSQEIASVGQLEYTVRHEMLHHTVETDPPSAFTELLTDLRNRIIEQFDFSDVPGSLKEAAIETVFDFAKARLEHVFITDELLKVAETFYDARTMLKLLNQNKLDYKKEYDDFFNKNQDCFINDPKTGVSTKVTIKPKRGDSDNKGGDITGDWILEASEGRGTATSDGHTDEARAPGFTQNVSIERDGSGYILIVSSIAKGGTPTTYRGNLVGNRLSLNCSNCTGSGYNFTLVIEFSQNLTHGSGTSVGECSGPRMAHWFHPVVVHRR